MPPPEEGDKRLPPHLRGKDIPTHLRSKYEHDGAENIKDQNADASASVAAAASSSKATTKASGLHAAAGPSESNARPNTSTNVAKSGNAPQQSLSRQSVAQAAPAAPAKGKAAAVSHTSPAHAKGPSTKDSFESKSSQQQVQAQASSKYSTAPESSEAVVAGPSASGGQGAVPAALPPNSRGRHNHHAQSQHSQRHDNRRGGRGHGFMGTRWLKNRDIPKPDPKRWETNWESEADACSVNTAGAESGMDNGDKKAAASPGIDPETGFQLTDYAGNWAPAPVNWDARPAFRASQSAETIEKWMERTEKEMAGIEWSIPQNDHVAPDGKTYYFAPDPKNEYRLIQGAVAPRYWTPVIIGNMSASTFWTRLVGSEKPKTCQEGDLDGARPWWEMYHGSAACTLIPYQQPKIQGIDPKETSEERLKRENDLGSLHHADNRKRAERAKIEAERDRQLQREARAKEFNIDWPASRPVIKVGLKLYLRPAREEDMQRLCEIYNYYIEHTVCVPELHPLSENDMMAKCVGVRGSSLPFFVACEKGEVKKGGKRNNYEDLVLPEKVVGFAWAENFALADYSPNGSNMNRFSCIARVYVDPSHYMKGIAKCLFDKLLGLLDPAHLESVGYDVEGDELKGVAPSRVISKIVVAVSYEKPERLEWKRRFLTEGLGFEQVGHMEGIAIKLGHR